MQIVPSSTLRNCAIYQAADQLRSLSHVAYRTAELNAAWPDHGFGDKERERWETDPAWQGFRELMENVLVAYDWGESLIALNVVAKPAVDECLYRQLAATARRHDDNLLAMIADSVYKDVQRSRTWTTAALRMAENDNTATSAIRDWVTKWRPLMENAVSAYCAALPDSPDAATEVMANVSQWQRSLAVAD